MDGRREESPSETTMANYPVLEQFAIDVDGPSVISRRRRWLRPIVSVA